MALSELFMSIFVIFRRSISVTRTVKMTDRIGASTHTNQLIPGMEPKPITLKMNRHRRQPSGSPKRMPIRLVI